MSLKKTVEFVHRYGLFFLLTVPQMLLAEASSKLTSPMMVLEYITKNGFVAN